MLLLPIHVTSSHPTHTDVRRIHAGHYDMSDPYDERYQEYQARLNRNMDRTSEL